MSLKRQAARDRDARYFLNTTQETRHWSIFRASFFAFLVGTLAGYVVVDHSFVVLRSPQVRSWPTTQLTVVALQRGGRSFLPMRSPAVVRARVRYETYGAERFGVLQRERCRELLGDDRVIAGATLEVFYDPNEPTVIVRRQSLGGHLSATAVGVTLFSLSVFILKAQVSRFLEYRRMEQAERDDLDRA